VRGGGGCRTEWARELNASVGAGADLLALGERRCTGPGFVLGWGADVRLSSDWRLVCADSGRSGASHTPESGYGFPCARSDQVRLPVNRRMLYHWDLAWWTSWGAQIEPSARKCAPNPAPAAGTATSVRWRQR
jgi:hypothetical protein